MYKTRHHSFGIGALSVFMSSRCGTLLLFSCLSSLTIADRIGRTKACGERVPLCFKVCCGCFAACRRSLLDADGGSDVKVVLMDVDASDVRCLPDGGSGGDATTDTDCRSSVIGCTFDDALLSGDDVAVALLDIVLLSRLLLLHVEPVFGESECLLKIKQLQFLFKILPQSTTIKCSFNEFYIR